jgi:hypothetical protein
VPAGIATCALCGEPMERGYPFAQMVRGWSLPREAGGQNAVHRREVVPDVVAHPACVKIKASSSQGRLV